MTEQKVDSRAAVLRALTIIGGGVGGEHVSAGGVLPTAKARAGIDFLCDAGAADTLRESDFNLKALLREILDWDGPKYTRGTKAVVRAVGAVMIGEDGRGHSTFTQGVEMTSFLCLIGPLLEPDRLARIAARASTTKNSYGPIRYHLGSYGQMNQMLRGYSEDRREMLLASLWDQAHDGRWWNHTVGDRRVRKNGHLMRRRRRVPTEQAEQQAAIAEQIGRLMGGRRGSPTAKLLASAIEMRALAFSREAAELMGRVPEPGPRERAVLNDILAGSDDEDHRVLASYLPWLLPDERGESAVPSMVALLLTANGGPADFDFNQFPEHPEQWEDLYPAASREPFPLPEAVKELDERVVPGLEGASVMMLLNADRLKKNSDYMGNCTFGYLSRCQHGQTVIGRITHLGYEYNFALNGGAGNWIVGEVNSRFNQGGVPREIKAGIDRLAGLACRG